MNFLGRSWCKLAWTEWVRFSDGDFQILPDKAGFYRIRPVGKKELAYIGQTGSSLKNRLKTLARETHRNKMPYNDPHTAAPNLWAWRNSVGMEYECSVAPRKLSKRDRLACECYLIWQYRLLADESPRCNLGRFHPSYVKSKGRTTGVRGRKWPRGGKNPAGGHSASSLRQKGQPPSSKWMGLSWSKDRGERGQKLPSAGLYKILRSDGQLLYVGKSDGHLINRARSHIRTKGLPKNVQIWVTSPKLLARKRPLPHHFLELENDLIASYYAKHRKAPPKQFLKAR